MKIMTIFFSLFYGTFMWMYLLLKDRKTVYVITDNGIGDIFPACGFIPTFKKRFNIDKVTIIGIKEKKQIYDMYEGTYDKVVWVSAKNFNLLRLFSSTDLFNAYVRLTNRIISTRLGSNSRGDYVLRLRNISYLETIKYGAFNLKKEDELRGPNVKKVDINQYVEKYCIEKGNTVILNPYANTINGIDIMFFELLAQALKQSGFKVITNISSETQKPIKGTDGLITTLNESYHLSEYCGFSIGLRSGYYDFIAYSNCKIVTLFPENYPFFDFQSLSKWGINHNLIDLVVERDWDKAQKKIIKYLKEE